MQKFILLFGLLGLAFSTQAQYGGPRLFLDLPVIYFHAPDLGKAGDRLGAGAEAAFNVGTHWSVARLGGGSTFTLAPKEKDVAESFEANPYALFEVGVGMYRSNGNRCAKTKQNAFTALAKGGLRYMFNPVPIVKNEEGLLDYTVGAEFSYFFIRDVFKNYEVFLAGNYLTKSKVVAANFGFKLFLNLRANR